MLDKYTFLFPEKLCSELCSLSLHKLTEVKNNITPDKNYHLLLNKEAKHFNPNSTCFYLLWKSWISLIYFKYIFI